MTVTNTAPPTISGTARQGQTLTTTSGTWTYDLDYLNYAYQWLRCDAAGANCVDIVGQTSAQLLLGAADVGYRIRSEVTATEGSTPTPALPWAPPTAGAGGVAVVNWTMTNANRMSSSLLSGSGRDLVITSGEVLTGPVQQLNGWRNVIWIGGAIDHTPGTGNNYALPISATGTVHLEGLDIACDGDATMCRGGSATCIWQIQNCRVSAHNIAAEHADCFQTQGGTKINSLRMARNTLITDYQGFFLRPPTSGSFVNGGDFRQLNFRRRVVGVDPSQAYMFIADEDPDTGHPTGGVGNIAMSDVWIEATHSSNNSVLYPSWNFDSSFFAGSAFSWRRGIFKETDGTGQYVRPSTPADVVPPGGTASGQSCLTPNWSGIIRMGVPPAGDWCPAGVPGVSYVSPGYS